MDDRSAGCCQVLLVTLISRVFDESLSRPSLADVSESLISQVGGEKRMSFKSFACMAALAAITMPAAALPTIDIVDNADGTATLNVITDAAGSLGAELSLELSGATLTGATVNETLFDTENPGDSPFIVGSPIGGDAMGLDLDLPNNRLFASFGSGDPGIGTFEFLTFTFDGVGTASAEGLVAQGSVLNDGLSDLLVDITQPGGLAADFNGDGTVDLLDLDILGSNFGDGPGSTMAEGDANGDGNVDLLDLDILGGTFGDTVGSSTSIPEPTAALLSLVALGGFAGFRRRGGKTTKNDRNQRRSLVSL